MAVFRSFCNKPQTRVPKLKGPLLLHLDCTFAHLHTLFFLETICTKSNPIIPVDQWFNIYIYINRLETRLYSCRPRVRNPLPFNIIYTNFFVVHRHSVILRPAQYWCILNGKGSNWLWSTWGQSCFHSFTTGKSNIAGCLQIQHFCSYIL